MIVATVNIGMYTVIFRAAGFIYGLLLDLPSVYVGVRSRIGHKLRFHAQSDRIKPVTKIHEQKDRLLPSSLKRLCLRDVLI